MENEPRPLTRRVRRPADPGLGLYVIGTALATLGVGMTAIQLGFREPPLHPALPQVVQALAAAALVVLIRRRAKMLPDEPTRVLDLGLGVIVVAGIIVGAFFGPASLAAHGATALLLLRELWRLNAYLSSRLVNPSLLFPLSFIFLIASGTLLIKLPVATPEDNPINWIDALFTMTSAVCVTGLTVRETLGDFTPVGHTIIGVFIQLGGLGLIIFGSTLALLLGGRLSFRQNITLSGAMEQYPAHKITSFIRFIVIATIIIELAVAAAMYPLWRSVDGSEIPPLQRVGLSLFHSVSAFCNAGFDLTGDSMVPYRTAIKAQLLVLTLVVLGSTGYFVLQDIGRVVWPPARKRAMRKGHKPPRLTLHSKLVISTTLIVYVAGFVAIFAAQIAYAGPAQLGQTVADAHFMSLAARTSGFNTVPMEELAPGSRFTLMVLMLIGGSPGSAAGGIKTVAVALLALSVIATLRQRSETEAFGRAVPDALVKKAATIAFSLIGLIVLATLILCILEPFDFERIFFECISAGTTTGLSLGITEELTPASKVVLTFTMFLGRVGALALFAALLQGKAHRGRYSYPHETVSLG